jgi:hypothetical protein
MASHEGASQRRDVSARNSRAWLVVLRLILTVMLLPLSVALNGASVRDVSRQPLFSGTQQIQVLSTPEDTDHTFVGYP